MSAPQLIPASSPFGTWLDRSLRGVETSAAEPETPPTRPGLLDLLRLTMYGHARIELTNLFRPDGGQARQLVVSAGIPPFGRLATRMTLDDFTGRPTAIHGEIILGWKPFSVGASLGRSHEEIIVTWFRRWQPSLASTNREITRLVVPDGTVELQRIGELKHYGRSLSTVEIGRARTYQFTRDHLREAFQLLEREGPESAAAFLKRQYPHIDEALARQGLLRRRLSVTAFGAELLASFGVSYWMSGVFTNGAVRHAAQNGAAYGIASLFRAGWGGLGPRRLSLAVAEGAPIALLHGLIGLGIDRAEEGFGERWRQRWIAEDFGSMAAYGYLKGRFFPRFLAVPEAAASEELAMGARTALRRPTCWGRFGPWIGLTVLAAGAIYYFTRPAPHPFVWEEFDRRFGPAERLRLGLEGSFREVSAPPRFPLELGLSALAAAPSRHPVPLPPAFDTRRAAWILARTLEGGDAPGPLATALRRCDHAGLSEALQGLNGSQRSVLERRLGPAGLRELLSLAEESDREFFYQGIASLAQREGEAGHEDAALSLWYPVALQSEFPDLRTRARAEIAGLLAEGGELRGEGMLR